MNSDPWSTFSEIKWIETLGRHHDHWNKPSYADFLRNYLSAAKKRRNWDRIDKKTVIGYAKDRLRNELLREALEAWEQKRGLA